MVCESAVLEFVWLVFLEPMTFSGRLALIPRPALSGQSLRVAQGMVSCVGCVCLPVHSPRERRNRLRVLWTDPTPCHLRLSYLIFRFGLPSGSTVSPTVYVVRCPGRPAQAV
jgi:hypothetical protein